MEREIISREIIKPSSPTPPHLRTHNLSLLDQIVPPIFVPLVIYFPAPEDSLKNADEFISQTTRNLKRSLSSTLTLFYPLAGVLTEDGFSIDCNDEGVVFVVTKIKGNLSDFLKNPDPAECRVHIPSELSWTHPAPGTNVAMVQVNYFDCGGVAIGSVFWHKVVDGITVSKFMKAWAANTRGGSVETKDIPNYATLSLFPQNKGMQSESHLFFIMKQYFKTGKTVMKRYVFDSSAISTIRAKLTSEDEDLKFRPSRVEIVSALIWKCFTIALYTVASNYESNRQESRKFVSLLSQIVNIRRKADPPLPDNSFGNLAWMVSASSTLSPSTNQIDVDTKQLVHKMRNAVRNVDGGFVRRMQGDEGFPGYSQNVEETWTGFYEKAEYLSVTSWCNFGVYDVDFGWGKPVWMSKCDCGGETDWPFLNMVWLIDTVHGDGIEAWVTLDEKYFEAFDKIQELRDLASIEPSPLDIAA